MDRKARVVKMLQSTLENIFREKGANFFTSTIVTVAHIDINANFGNVNVYLSFISNKDPKDLFQEVDKRKVEIRHELAKRVKNRMRRVPELNFVLDTLLEEAYSLEKFFGEGLKQ